MNLPVLVLGCPDCGGELTTERVTQMALVRHGGYGADRQSSSRYCCACGYEAQISVTECSPRGR